MVQTNTARELSDKVSALSEQRAQLQQDNLQLEVRCEAALQACNISRAVLNSYVHHRRHNDSLNSILATPGDYEQVLSALDQQAQEVLQVLEQQHSTPPPNTPPPTASFPPAPAASGAACVGAGGVSCPLRWTTHPQQFIEEVVAVLDWSAPLPILTEYEDIGHAIISSLKPLLSACQQAKDPRAAAAADQALRVYFRLCFASLTQHSVLKPASLAAIYTPWCAEAPTEFRQDMTADGQLPDEQLQQVALLFGAFKQLSQPYVELRQHLQQLLSTMEHSVAGLLSGPVIPALAAPAEQVVRALLPGGDCSTRVLVTDAVRAIASAAAAAANSCAANSSAPAALSSSTPPAAAAAPGSALAGPKVPLGVLGEGHQLQMTPDVLESLSRQLDRVMRKLAWLEYCFHALLGCLLSPQQHVYLFTASLPYVFNAVAWAAHVAEQVQQQQVPVQQQLQSCQSSNIPGTSPGHAPVATSSLNTTLTGSGAGSCAAWSNSGCAAAGASVDPASVEQDIAQMVQAMRGVFISQGPATRAELLQAAAAYHSRHVAAVGAAGNVAHGAPRALQQQQQQQQQQPGVTTGQVVAAATVVQQHAPATTSSMPGTSRQAGGPLAFPLPPIPPPTAAARVAPANDALAPADAAGWMAPCDDDDDKLDELLERLGGADPDLLGDMIGLEAPGWDHL